MSLVFGALVAQMSYLLLILLPLPHIIRVRILNAYSTLRKNSNVKVGVVFSLVLLTLQFVDCVKKLQKYAGSSNPYYAQFQLGQQMGGQMLYDNLASKFFAQRNLYITGAVLYLAVAINTVHNILDKLVKKETEYRVLSKQSAAEAAKGDLEETQRLRDLLSLRDKDISAMKKQLEGIQVAYDLLNDNQVRSKDD